MSFHSHSLGAPGRPEGECVACWGLWGAGVDREQSGWGVMAWKDRKPSLGNANP